MLNVIATEQKLIVTYDSINAINNGYSIGDEVRVYWVDYIWDKAKLAFDRWVTVSRDDVGRGRFRTTDLEYQSMRTQWIKNNGTLNQQVGVVIAQSPNVSSLYLVDRDKAHALVTHLRMHNAQLSDYSLEKGLNGRQLSDLTPDELNMLIDYAYDESLEYGSNPIFIETIEIEPLPAGL